MVRLVQIIVFIFFLRTTDVQGEEEERRGEEQLFPASEAAENRLHQGKKKGNPLKIPPLPLVLTLHLSIPPISICTHRHTDTQTHTHTHTYTHTICFYQHTLTSRALMPAEVQEWVGSGSWGHHRVSNHRWGGQDSDPWVCISVCMWVCGCVCVWLCVCVCVCLIRGSISPTSFRIYSLSLHCFLYPSLYRKTILLHTHTYTHTHIYISAVKNNALTQLIQFQV